MDFARKFGPDALKKHSDSKALAGNSVAVACAHGDTLAAGGAAAAQHRGSALGLHAGAEAVGLRAAMAIGLKCALGHRNALLFLK